MTIPFENVFELIQNRFISNLELIIQIDKTWGLRHKMSTKLKKKKIVLIKSSPGGATAAQILVVIANILKGTSKTELSGKGSI